MQNKYFILFSFLLVVLFAPEPIHAQSEAIQNGGFETGDHSPWVYIAGFSIIIPNAATNLVALNGEYSLDIGCGMTPCEVKQEFTPSVIATAALSFWVLVPLDPCADLDEYCSPSFNLTVQYSGSQESYYLSSQLTGSGWKKIEIPVSQSDEIQSVAFEVFNISSLYIDDISLLGESKVKNLSWLMLFLDSSDGNDQHNCWDLNANGKCDLYVEDKTLDGICDTLDCQVPPQISEIRIDQSGTDNDEYFELAGPAGSSLDKLTYIVIGDGTGGSGVIENVTDLSGNVISGSGFFVVAESTFTIGTANFTTNLNFENSDNVTHILVKNFTGSNGDDLDTDDDGILDITPWSEIVDCVALIETNGSGDMIYCNEYNKQIGPNGLYVPAHIYSCFGFWEMDDLVLSGDDTPGAENSCIAY